MDFNITEFIIRHIYKLGIMMSSNGENLVRYFMDNNLTNLFGNNEITSDNIDLVTSSKNMTTSIDIESVYTEHVKILIQSVEENKLDISIFENDELKSALEMTNEYVKDTTSYMSDVTEVKEYKEVDMEHGDARKFLLSRSENGELIYEGELQPILASNGSNEFFNFSYKGQEEEEKSKSFLQKIVDGVKDSNLISVNTSHDIHSLTTYVDRIYTALQDKLEAKRVKKDVKVRKRVNPKAHA